MKKKLGKIGWVTATALVVANMIGTGVFTSLGFQVVDVTNTWSIILLWALGGVIALSGAFAYAELGAFYGKSGGEYLFLSKLYHPLVGYLAGWISLTVGFAAPVALAAMALGSYLDPYLECSSELLALLTVIIISVIHSFNLAKSSLFQNISTMLKVLLILGILVVGMIYPGTDSGFDWSRDWSQDVWQAGFAISLIYVTYSYTGWNAAAYIVEEIEVPAKNLPKALVRGTLLVTVLYVLLQVAFLKHTPIELLSGQVEVGDIFARQIFGPEGGRIISVMIAIFLMSSISAMIWVGPRVTAKMAADYWIWSFLKTDTDRFIPIRALWFQALLSVVLILSGTFETILLYCGFILMLSSAMAVFGVFIIRHQAKEQLPYKNPTHPVLPIVFLMVSLWTLVFLLTNKPVESLWGLLNLLLGAITWIINNRYKT